MRSKQQNNITALYCRLSKDDEYQGDSMSIQNQKAMLEQYAKDKGYFNIEYYVDDGYSGTNFDRPDFKRLINDVENGRIGTVIVKDLSRLGREYLMTGYYSEVFFPQKDVHFIAVNDNVDSELGDNEFAPFKNIINEWYAKDISKKIRAALHTKALKGDCLTGLPPYGYDKDPADRTRLIPNDRAEYVKLMYRLAIEGKSCGEIAAKLREMNLLIPKADYLVRIGAESNGNFPKYPYYWLKATVKCILLNPVYTGKTVANRSTRRSFKDKRKLDIPQEDWIITEGTHEALVSQEDYDTVYKRLSVKSHSKTTNPDNIFRGLVKCPDCGKVHGFSKRYQDRDSKGAYRCQTAIKYGKQYCSAHYITFEQLYGVVLSDIKLHAGLAAENSEEYLKMLTSISDSEHSAAKTVLIKESEKSKKRIAELDTLIQKMYEDMVFGVISKERYATMSENMEKEFSTVKARLNEITSVLKNSEKNAENAKRFIQLIENYTDITELDYELVHTLIEKIYIHERQNIEGKAVVKVDIYYRFIGYISNNDNPTEVNRRRS